MRLALEESHIDLYWIESEGRRFEEVDFILPLTRRLNWKWAKWIEGGRLRTHFAICDCCVLKIYLLWTKTTAVFVFQELSIVIFRPSLQLILKCTKSELNGWKCVALNFNVMFQMNKLFFSNTCQFVDFRLKSTFNYKEKTFESWLSSWCPNSSTRGRRHQKAPRHWMVQFWTFGL